MAVGVRAMRDESFPYHYRLHSGADFRQVFNTKCSVADGCLIIYGAIGRQPNARLGLSVSRKVGNAVCRNHWKRGIREAFRRQNREWPQPLDIVVIPRQTASPDALAIAKSFRQLVKRVHRKLTG